MPCTKSEVDALREQVAQLKDFVQKLAIEFKSMKHEVVASHTDIMDSVHLAISLCIAEHSIK